MVMNAKPDGENTPRFRPDRAFVVQFSSLTGGDGFESGRVEHVVTGRAQNFEDRQALMSFMATTLAGVESGAESVED